MASILSGINNSNTQGDLTENTLRYSFHTMNTIAERLKHAMLQAGDISQTELAESAGVSQPTIWKLLNGKSRKSKELPTIASALGVNLEWLATGRGEMIGGENIAAPRVDLSKLIPVWSDDGETPDFVTSPGDKPAKSWRAYKMKRNTGVSEAPAGSIIVVDTAIEPGTGDIVLAMMSGKVSAYRYVTGADGSGFLSVDDNRVPMASVSEESLIGVAIYLIRDLRT